jgi:hypothetical protein
MGLCLYAVRASFTLAAVAGVWRCGAEGRLAVCCGMFMLDEQQGLCGGAPT